MAKGQDRSGGTGHMGTVRHEGRATATPKARRFWASKVDVLLLLFVFLPRHTTETFVVGVQPKVMPLLSHDLIIQSWSTSSE